MRGAGGGYSTRGAPAALLLLSWAVPRWQVVSSVALLVEEHELVVAARHVHDVDALGGG